MNKITEDYVSYEIAKLLKKKGFDEPSRIWYDDKGVISQRYIDATSNPLGKNYSFAAPTQSLALKWLREVHRIEIHIVLSELNADNSKKYMFDIYSSDINRGFDSVQKEEFNSYEEAVEAAIKYTLENLI